MTTNGKLALEQMGRRAGQLYSLPAVALEVLELTQQQQVDIRALKDCIENDPALTGKVLRVVNSALFGLSREVGDLSQALSLMGVKPLKLLVLGFALSDAVFSQISGRCIERYWRHTLTKAVAARELSETLWRIPADESFLVALLQDLGLLVLLQELGEPFADFLERVWLADGDVLRLERDSLGFDHRELTARVLTNWGLPANLVAGVLADRNEREFASKLPNRQALPHVLRMAELLADLLAERRPKALERLLAAEANLSLSHEQLHALTGQLQSKVHALADVFSLTLPEGQDYRDVLAQAHARLAVVAEEAAKELLGGGPSRMELDADAERKLLAEAVELTAELRRCLTQIPASAAVDSSSGSASPPPATGKPETIKPDTSQAAAVKGAASKIAPAKNADAKGGDVKSSPAKPTTARSAAATPSQSKKTVAAASEPIEVFDPSLDIDPVLASLLVTSVAACRHSRAPLSLALIEIDQFGRIEREQGELIAEELLGRVGGACRELGGTAALCRQVRPVRFALVLPGWDRHQASEFYQQLSFSLRDVIIEEPNGRISPLRLNVGLAAVTLPPKNFAPQSLLESASRCLGAVHRSGGGTLKSIGIY